MRESCKAVHSLRLTVNSGQSLIEVVIGMAIATLLTVALVSVTIYTQKLSLSAKNNTQATKLVQQSIEEVRAIRDRRGFDVLTSGTCFKISKPTSDPSTWMLSSAAPCPEIANPSHLAGDPDFSRKIEILSGANLERKQVVVTVTWTESSGTQTVTNSTFLSRICSGQVGSGASPCP